MQRSNQPVDLQKIIVKDGGQTHSIGVNGLDGRI